MTLTPSHAHVLRFTRSALDITRQEIAVDLGLNQSWIFGVENVKKPCKRAVSQVTALLSALGLTIDEFESIAKIMKELGFLTFRTTFRTRLIELMRDIKA